MCMSLFVPDFVIEHLICKQIFFSCVQRMKEKCGQHSRPWHCEENVKGYFKSFSNMRMSCNSYYILRRDFMNELHLFIYEEESIKNNFINCTYIFI